MLRNYLLALIPLTALIFIVYAWLEIDFRAQKYIHPTQIFGEETIIVGHVSDLNTFFKGMEREKSGLFANFEFGSDLTALYDYWKKTENIDVWKKQFKKTDIYFGLYQVAGKIEILWIIEPQKEPVSWLKETTELLSEERLEGNIDEGAVSELSLAHSKWYAFKSKGLLIFSRNKDLVVSSVERIDKLDSQKQTDFQVSRYAELNLFLNKKQLRKVYTLLFGESEYLDWIVRWYSQVQWDCHFKEEGIFMSAITSDITGLDEAIVENSHPVSPSRLSLLPEGTTAYLWMSLKQEGYYNIYRKQLKNNLKNTQSDLAFEYLKWIEGQTVFLHFKNEKMLILSNEQSSYDPLLMIEEINLKSGKSNTDDHVEKIDYLNYSILRFLGGDVLSSFFPDFLIDKALNYFVVVENNLIFSADEEVLKDFLDKHSSGHILYSEDEIEKTILKNHGAQMRFLFGHQLSFNQSENPFSRWYTNKFSQSDRLFYWSIAGNTGSENKYLHHLSWVGAVIQGGSDSSINNSTEWAKDIDFTPTGVYITYSDPIDGSMILIEGQDQNLHYINARGDEIKRVKLSGNLVGKPQFLSANKGSNKYLLFNTANEIYLTDLKGNILKGFPYKSTVEISGTSRVFDYENDGNLRIVSALSNGDVLNLDKSGKKVQGWVMKKVDEKFVSYPRHFIREGKDYLCFFTASQKLYAVDRRGNLRPGFPLDFSGWTGGEVKLTPASTVAESYIRYISEDGVLKRIFFSGKKDEIILENKGKHFIWDLEDLTGDGKLEFIATRAGYISVYNDIGIEIFSFPAKVTDIHLMQIISKRQGENYLGFFGKQRKQLNMVTPFGEALKGFPVEATNLFLTIDVDGDGTRELVYFNNNQLICTSKW